MPIFTSAAQMRNLQTRSGDLEGSQPLFADMFTARLQSKMKQFGKESQTKTMEFTSRVFEDFGFKEQEGTKRVREEGLKQAGEESAKALGAINVQKHLLEEYLVLDS